MGALLGALLVAGCGNAVHSATAPSTSTTSASTSTASPSTSTAAPATCDARSIVAAIQAERGSSVRIVYNGHLACAGRLAEISVMVDNLESLTPGWTGPVGSPHGALMELSGGSWHEVDLSKPNPYCSPDGHPSKAVPARLGTVCGIQ